MSASDGVITREVERQIGKGSKRTRRGWERDHFNPLYCDSAAINLLIG